MTTLRRIGYIAAIWACSTAGLWAQEIVLSVLPGHVGLGGVVRSGTFAALNVTIENRSSQFREVHCEWILDDVDGDSVHARRTVPLNPQRTEQVWLYAIPPFNLAFWSKVDWKIQVIDSKTGKLLANQSVFPNEKLSPEDRVIAIVGGGLGVGLRPFGPDFTQHERCRFITGLTPSTLPDRWLGYSVLQALIWTPLGASPDAVPARTQRAIREWLRRGGHLVIVLNTVGDPWADSAMRDLLPVSKKQMVPVSDIDPPGWLGQPVRSPRGKTFLIDATVFRPDPDVAVLKTDQEGRPLVIAKEVGFGRVTVIGVNLADPQLIRHGLPSSFTHPEGSAKEDRLWGAVFGWRMPVLTQAYIDGEIRQHRMSRPDSRRSIQLADVMGYMPPVSAMRETTTPALLAAILVFGLYWLIAGPIGFGVLKARDQLRHSWLVFTAVVLGFTAITWAGAFFIRPSKSRIAHFTVLDMDAGSGLVRTHSWLSLFKAGHGKVEVALESDESATGPDYLSAAVVFPKFDRTVFLNPQHYLVSSVQPVKVRFPWRATAKTLELDHLRRDRGTGGGLADLWPMPQASFESISGWPKGKLWHVLPDTLTNVLLVYCPGHGQEPWVWKASDWPPGKYLELDGQPVNQRLASVQFDREGKMVWRGHLGILISRKAAHLLERGNLDPSQITLPTDQRVKIIDMLGFYSSLPPPDFRQTGFPGPRVYRRTIGRELDLTHLLDLRRLIVVGHLPESSLPVPLQVDGRTIPSRGWTVVRWICPLE